MAFVQTPFENLPPTKTTLPFLNAFGQLATRAEQPVFDPQETLGAKSLPATHGLPRLLLMSLLFKIHTVWCVIRIIKPTTEQPWALII